jgi:hypothetical protein
MATVMERGEEAPVITVGPEAATPARPTTLYDLTLSSADAEKLLGNFSRIAQGLLKTSRRTPYRFLAIHYLSRLQPPTGGGVYRSTVRAAMPEGTGGACVFGEGAQAGECCMATVEACPRTSSETVRGYSLTSPLEQRRAVFFFSPVTEVVDFLCIAEHHKNFRVRAVSVNAISRAFPDRAWAPPPRVRSLRHVSPPLCMT